MEIFPAEALEVNRERQEHNINVENMGFPMNQIKI